MTAASRSGMSLVESIIAIAIFVVITSALLLSILMGNRSYALTDAVVHVQEEVRRGFDNIDRKSVV